MTNGQTSRKLNLFDVTNLVIGGTVGAYIYIVASLGSAYLGPASLLVWLVAGAIAVILALNFAEAAALVPRVGDRLPTHVKRAEILLVLWWAGPSGLPRSLH